MSLLFAIKNNTEFFRWLPSGGNFLELKVASFFTVANFCFFKNLELLIFVFSKNLFKFFGSFCLVFWGLFGLLVNNGPVMFLRWVGNCWLG